MQAFAHDGFRFPLPTNHRFPLEKYALLRDRADAHPRIAVRNARAASWDELGLAHDADHLAALRAGTLSRNEELALGLPWSPELLERGRRSVGATLEAAPIALEQGVAANLGGGTHHAATSRSRGFCTFNDVVCATRTLRAAGALNRVLVVDLDVHQGDGTHESFADDAESFTFALNGFRNYPFRRVPGDLEHDFADGTTDEMYLDVLANLLPQAIERARPDLCFYLAGADPWEGDRLGRLALTQPGLAARDALVRSELLRAGVPVCILLAGGYGEPISRTVEINLATLTAFAT